MAEIPPPPLDYLDRSIERAHAEVQEVRTVQAWSIVGTVAAVAALSVTVALAFTHHPLWAVGVVVASLAAGVCIVRLSQSLVEVRSARAARRRARDQWVRATFEMDQREVWP